MPRRPSAFSGANSGACPPVRVGFTSSWEPMVESERPSARESSRPMTRCFHPASHSASAVLVCPPGTPLDSGHDPAAHQLERGCMLSPTASSHAAPPSLPLSIATRVFRDAETQESTLQAQLAVTCRTDEAVSSLMARLSSSVPSASDRVMSVLVMMFPIRPEPIGQNPSARKTPCTSARPMS
jgi:hypothetical protein